MKKIERRNFFKSAGLGVSGFILFQSLPFKLFANSRKTAKPENSASSMVKLHPLAVSRKKIGEKNV